MAQIHRYQDIEGSSTRALACTNSVHRCRHCITSVFSSCLKRQHTRDRKGTPLGTVFMLGVALLSHGAAASEALGYIPAALDPIERGNLFDTRDLRSDSIDGWALSFDNDVLVPSSRDQDYTYGVSVTISGDVTRDYAVSLDAPLSWLNQRLIPGNGMVTPSNHAIEFGVYGFTPEDITIAEANPSDRPYAGIVYTSAIQELITPNPDVAWRTSLTFGILGLDIVGDLQNDVHKAIGSEEAKGWEHQISDGGEPTARYSIARQRLWHSPVPYLEIKTTAQTSVGYLTEASYGVSLRLGRIASRWQSFNPELTTYGEQANQVVDEQYRSESYWMMGAAVKARFYNAFLQGQFRNSEVEYNRDELNTGILEAWAGYSHSFNSGFRLTYLLRGHTSELRRGDGDRNVVWGGLTLSYKF